MASPMTSKLRMTASWMIDSAGTHLRRARCIVGSLRRTRGCAPGRRAGPSSQRSGFFQNAASKQPVETLLGDHIDWPAEEMFQFLDESGREPRARRFTRIHQQVDIALRGRFPSGDGPEDADVGGSVTGRAAQNIVASLTEKPFDWDDGLSPVQRLGQFFRHDVILIP